jgi:hypothetical protein
MEKIKYLKQLAKSVGMESVTEPIIEVIDRRLRNAIFHSDYSVGHDGEVIIYNPEHIYTKREVLIILNRSLAYHEAMKNLIATYTKSYDSPKIIKVSSSFNPDPDARAQIIVREKHGVTALKASRSKQQIQDGQVAWELGNYLSYEPEMVRAGRYLLPPSRVDYWNAILKKLPSTIGKPITNFIEKNVINRKYRE